MKFLYTCLILLFSVTGIAQTIEGTVKTQRGEPIPLASVSVLNSTKATSSSTDGRFTLMLS